MTNPDEKPPFVDSYTHSVDAKGRVTIPSDWRLPDEESGKYLAIPWRDEDNTPHLRVWPPWKARVYSQKLAQIPESDAKGRAQLKKIFKNAGSLECDKTGRFVIPPKHRKYAGITKKAHFSGVGDQFEIWNPELLPAEEGEEELEGLSAEDFGVFDG
jgi:MraZ protein